MQLLTRNRSVRETGIPPGHPNHCSDRPGILEPIFNFVGGKIGFKSNVDRKVNCCLDKPSYAITRCDWCEEIFPGL